MARSPKFTALLAEMAALHDKKNADYAKDGDPFSNFREAADVARGFTGKDAVYATLIGVKLARLRELLSSGKAPNNESVDDTRRDLAMYATLWAADTLGWSYDDSRLWHNGGPHAADATGEPV